MTDTTKLRELAEGFHRFTTNQPNSDEHKLAQGVLDLLAEVERLTGNDPEEYLTPYENELLTDNNKLRKRLDEAESVISFYAVTDKRVEVAQCVDVGTFEVIDDGKRAREYLKGWGV